MSRVFKPKAAASKPETKKSEKSLPKMELRAKRFDLGVTLVEETPEKPQVLSASLSATGGSFVFGQPKFGLPPNNGNGKVVEKPEPPPPLAPLNDDDDGEEEWLMDSSPDIVLLNPPLKGRGGRMNDEVDGDEDEDDLMIVATPTKPSRSGRGQKRRR
jgi:hypothetical protein